MNRRVRTTGKRKSTAHVTFITIDILRISSMCGCAGRTGSGTLYAWQQLCALEVQP